MCANLHNARYDRRQFLAPATSFTDPAATCATYPERLQPRQCVFNSLRQHSVSSDCASAARTSAALPGPRNDSSSPQKRLRFPQQCSATCGASPSKAAVPDSLRQYSFSSDCASAARTPAAKTSHWIGVRSFQQCSQAPQSHAQQERLGSTTQTATPVIQQVQVPPEAVPHPCTFRRLTQAFRTTPRITRRVSDHCGSTQSKPDQVQDTSVHTEP